MVQEEKQISDFEIAQLLTYQEEFKYWFQWSRTYTYPLPLSPLSLHKESKRESKPVHFSQICNLVNLLYLPYKPKSKHVMYQVTLQLKIAHNCLMLNFISSNQI